MGVVPVVERRPPMTCAGGSLNTRCTILRHVTPSSSARVRRASLLAPMPGARFHIRFRDASRTASACGSAATASPPTTTGATPAEIEQLGYAALWFGEAPGGKEAFTRAATLLAATDSLVVATGIASIWGRDPLNTASAIRTVGEAFPGDSSPGSASAIRRRSRPAASEYRAPLVDDARVPGGAWPATHQSRRSRRSRRRSCSPHCGRRCSSWRATRPTERTRTSCPSSTRAAHARSSAPGKLLAPELAVVLEPRPRRGAAAGPPAHRQLLPRRSELRREPALVGLRRRRLRGRRIGRAGRRGRGVGRRGRRSSPASQRTPRGRRRPRVPAAGDRGATAPGRTRPRRPRRAAATAPALRDAGLLAT